MQKNILSIFIVLILVAAAGIAGTVYFGIRAGDYVELERELKAVNSQLEEQRTTYWRIIDNYRRNHDEFSRVNTELERTVEQLQSDLAEGREQYRLIAGHNERLGKYIGELERNNRRIETILLGIAARAGYSVDRDNSR